MSPAPAPPDAPERTDSGAPGPSLSTVLGFLALGVVAGLLGFALGGRLPKPAGGWHVGPIGIVWALLAWFLAVAVHEGGHLLGGALQGMRPLLYMVGPLRLTWSGRGVRVSFNRDASLWGGLAAAMPSDTTDLARRMQWMVLAGPLASVALAVAAALVALAGDDGGRAFALLTALVSGAIALATMIPAHAGGLASDGAQWLAYRRGGPEAERRALLLVLVGQSLAGRRPRDLDREAIDRALELPADAASRLAVLSIAACAAVDRGDDASACFAEMAGKFFAYPAAFRASLALWLAWHAVSAHAEVETAKAWRALGTGGVVDPELRDLADASIARAEGDAVACRAAVARGLARGPALDPGGSLLVRELLRKLGDDAGSSGD